MVAQDFLAFLDGRFLRDGSLHQPPLRQGTLQDSRLEVLCQSRIQIGVQAVFLNLGATCWGGCTRCQLHVRLLNIASLFSKLYGTLTCLWVHTRRMVT